MILIVIAGLGAFALVVGKVARRFVPEIVVFLALGVLIGPQGPIDLINAENIPQLNLLTQVALGAIIFLIGDRLRIDVLRRMRSQLLPVNIGQILATGGLVFVATRAAGASPRLSLILAIIAAESGVLTVTAIVAEQRSHGRLTDMLLTSVGLTNVVVAALFGLVFPFVLAAESTTATGAAGLVFLRLVIGSAIIGIIGGWILRTFGAAIELSGELLLFLMIVLTGMVGIASVIEGSVVISTLIAGLLVANSSPWLADRFFAAIRVLESPFYLIFFVVAGASIHLDQLSTLGAVGAAYLVARALGKVAGAALGGLALGGGGSREGAQTGLGLLPHAGMAIALVATVIEQLPELGAQVSTIVLGSIVVFELTGPLAARRALRASGEVGKLRRPGTANITEEIERRREISRVLIPVGGLTAILPRLGFLLDLVASLDAELVLVHVSRPGTGLTPEQEPEVLQTVRRLAEERNIRCTTVHRVSERIARVVAETVREHQVDLVIMGEPARTSVLEPTRWGLVAQRVIRDVEVPILIYPVDPADPSRAPTVYVRRAQRAEVADAAASNMPAREPPEEATEFDDDGGA